MFSKSWHNYKDNTKIKWKVVVGITDFHIRYHQIDILKNNIVLVHWTMIFLKHAKVSNKPHEYPHMCVSPSLGHMVNCIT